MEAETMIGVAHGTSTGYRKGCRCEECREASRISSMEGRARARQGIRLRRTSDAIAAKLDAATALLEDGASYREVSKTVGVDPQWLKGARPGYDNNAKEWNSVRRSIMHREPLAKLHREIWQGMRY